MRVDRMDDEALKAELARGYTATHRRLEIAAFLLWCGLYGWAVLRLIDRGVAGLGWEIPVALVLGVVVADWVSGTIHWACDTWGSARTPVVGQSVIRTFREHHVDQTAITRHGFIETNGACVVGAIPWVILGIFAPVAADTALGKSVTLWTVSVGVFGAFTSQIHKWSHQVEPPWLVRALQNLRLILPAAHHQVHHTAPHTGSYCITAGWLNPLLDRSGYWRVLERLITAVTGAVPRAEDASFTGSALVEDSPPSSEPAPRLVAVRRLG
jgi:plasmanylethanolamine desaturase